MSSKFSSSEAVGFGWKTVTSNFGFFITLMLILLGVNIVLGFISNVSFIKDSFPTSIIFSLISWVISSILTLGYTKIYLDFVRVGKSDLKELFNNHEQLFNYIAATVLYSLIVLGGFLLLIVPGIIWSIKYGLYTTAIVDKKFGPVEALKYSGQITKGEKWNLFGFGMLCLGVNILGLLCLGVGLFVTIPATLLAGIYVYNKLASGASEVVTPPVVEAPVVPAV